MQTSVTMQRRLEWLKELRFTLAATYLQHLLYTQRPELASGASKALQQTALHRKENTRQEP